MARRIKRISDVEIIDIADKGRSIGRAPDGRILMVEKAVPGDIVDVRVLRKRKGMLLAVPENYSQLSEQRTRPFCRHFGTCGGCKWQHLDYAAQIRYKGKAVRDAIVRLAGIEAPEIKPIVGSPEQKYYRNKLEYTFTDQRWLTKEELDSDQLFDRRGLGFHVPGSFARVLDLEECYLQPHPSNEIRLAVRRFALDHNLPFQDIRKRTGLLRNLIIRNNEQGEIMLIIIFLEDQPEIRSALFEEMKDQFPQIVSCYYCINDKLNDSYFDLEFELHWGREKLRQTLGHVIFDMGPKSFYQTNPVQAKTLYDITRDMAALTKEDAVIDLYSGIGSISLYIAASCKQVAGVEEIEEAVEDAKANAALNKVQNAAFFAGDARSSISEALLALEQSPGVVITDPPRAGMHESVVAQILQINPRKIVYVSCNPSTQSRDIGLMTDRYEFVCAQPVDMFPHTSHIENVALLKRRT